ncbi:MAG: type II toxin-antitoxin system VapC family toxin, partial [Bryobacterales bacterium]|nr:type II toxin-antitoxin system VapC family toxin [Bryobacterales bacterium]
SPMVIDSSAILAILFGESEAWRYAVAIERNSKRQVSAVSLLEVSIVLASRKGPSQVYLIDRFIEAGCIAVTPFDEWQSRRSDASPRISVGDAPSCRRTDEQSQLEKK